MLDVLLTLGSEKFKMLLPFQRQPSAFDTWLCGTCGRHELSAESISEFEVGLEILEAIQEVGIENEDSPALGLGEERR